MKEYFEDVINALPQRTERLNELADLIEYPEIQADKKYYLALLEEYNGLKTRVGVLTEIAKCVDEYESIDTTNLPENERELFDREKSALLTRAYELRASLSGGSDEIENVIFYVTAGSSLGLAHKVMDLMIPYLTTGGKLIKSVTDSKGMEIELTGKGAFFAASKIWGSHKVLLPNNRTDKIIITAVRKDEMPKFVDSDFKVTTFHSSGAGGQNINKLDTAVRVTYLPTGKTVTCQDERSQLRNKQRALDTMKKRLISDFVSSRDIRYLSLRKSQESITGAFIFDSNNDTVVCKGVTYPISDEGIGKIIYNLRGEVKPC